MRGLFGSFNQLFISVGIILAKALGLRNHLHYTDISLIAIGILVLFAILLLFVKETPPWLYKKGKDLEGNQTLNFLRGPRADVAEEIRGIQSTLTDTGSFMDQLKAFRKRSVYLPVILILFLMFFQQFSGIYYVANFHVIHVYNATSPFYMYTSYNFQLMVLLEVGVFQFFATFTSAALVDFLGRKTLLVLSSCVMVICSTGLGIYFSLFDCYEIWECGPFLPVLNMRLIVLLYIISFSLGWGPIPWVMMSELVPLQVRGLASAAATFVNWLLVFSVAVIFSHNDAATNKFAWCFISFVMLGSIFFVLFLLPETKRCTLGEIEEHFKKGQVLYNPCKSMVQRSHRRQGCTEIELCI